MKVKERELLGNRKKKSDGSGGSKRRVVCVYVCVD